MGEKSRFVCSWAKLIWHLRIVVPCRDAAALSRRLRASASVRSDAFGDWNCAIDELVNVNGPSAFRYRYMLDG
jgi:hypothetical protein